MTIYVIRHASAGKRGTTESDQERALDEHGRAQARLIAETHAHLPIAAVYSSPAVRCIETVEPLAAELGVGVERHDSLLEGSSAFDALDLVEASLETHTVLCSHGDVIPELLQLLVNRGLSIGPDRGFAKGSVWKIETNGDGVTSATYTPMTV